MVIYSGQLHITLNLNLISILEGREKHEIKVTQSKVILPKIVTLDNSSMYFFQEKKRNGNNEIIVSRGGAI